MSTDTTQLLAEIPLFSTMDDEERRLLRAIMKERSFQPGQVVMATGDAEAICLTIEQSEEALHSLLKYWVVSQRKF